ncbi:PspC domain-containing protein [Herbidospora galbida]|uniref:PspC domain-containing protein n=1 Tax=Herbidospora galbida TaxID=2575442 RepID=A0A4V5UYZ1_9ACTN|nr:PspC domain-containing protein [Herbidospora galbida]TKK86743.1 PspC domain-containing protein [Herbidospora galbida]
MHRSRQHKMIAGVCGGIAERFNMSPTVVRLLFLASCILPGPQFIAYLIMWVVFPKAPARNYAHH